MSSLWVAIQSRRLVHAELDKPESEGDYAKLRALNAAADRAYRALSAVDAHLYLVWIRSVTDLESMRLGDA